MLAICVSVSIVFGAVTRMRTLMASWFPLLAALCIGVAPSRDRKSKWAPPLMRAIITFLGMASPVAKHRGDSEN